MQPGFNMTRKKTIIITTLIAVIIFATLAIFLFRPRTTEWKGETFHIVNVSHDMQVMLKQDEYKKFRTRGADCFTGRILANFRHISRLKFELPNSPKLTFYILKGGEEYKRMSGLPFESGMGGGDGLGTTALVVDDKWFFGTPDEGYSCDRVTVGLTHELAHLILNSYQKNNFNEAFEEGWAELITQYLAGMDGNDAARTDMMQRMTPGDIYELEWLMDNCMYCDDGPQIPAQHRKTYISMYFWMRGYIHLIEQKYGLDKMDAFNFMMQKWTQMPEFATRAEWMSAIGNLVDMSGEDVLNTKKLQLIGQKAVLAEL